MSQGEAARIVVAGIAGDAGKTLLTTGLARAFRDRGLAVCGIDLSEQMIAEAGRPVRVPPLNLCTDNAAMGAIAVERLRDGAVESLALDVFPGLVRAQPGER